MRVKVGDYVTYISNVGHRYRGVVTQLSHIGKRVRIRRVAICKNRKWTDSPTDVIGWYRCSRIKSILPCHIATQYKLKGI